MSPAVKPARTLTTSESPAKKTAEGKTKKRPVGVSIKETDLYPPLKAWLEDLGYSVFGEVANCDIAARRGDELVLVEIKRAVNIDLLLQLTRRQQAEASVYAAVPGPEKADKRWRELTRLLKRLEAGLLLVYLSGPVPRVELAFHPVKQERRKNKKMTKAILTEIAGRSRDCNIGGSNRRKLMTAYREQALAVAVALESRGASSPKSLRALGASDKAGLILHDNHYGWFQRLERGIYDLTGLGRQALAEHRALADELRRVMSVES